MLPLLKEPELRARISPAVFLQWNRHLLCAPQDDLEGLKLYAAERRRDFDEAQQTELDALLERCQKALDPAILNEIRRQQQEEERHRMEESMRQMRENMRGRNHN